VLRWFAAFDVGFPQDLQHRLGERAQEVAIIGLLKRVHQCHSVVGHRVLRRLRLKSANSTLAAWPDGHPRLHRIGR
jgi:hypothetical protein